MTESLAQKTSARLHSTSNRPVCLNIHSHIDPRFGGVVSSTSMLASAVESRGRFTSPIAAFARENETLGLCETTQYQLFPNSYLEWLRNRAHQDRFRLLVSNADLLHIHGIWQLHCAVSCQTALSRSTPYIISAHGMLDPWALGQKRLKKYVYSRLIEFRNLSRAFCLRALTRFEAMQYRAFGLKQPIAIVPNGIAVPNEITASLFLETYPSLKGKKIVLYLGRIHRKKGIIELCRAWLLLRGECEGAHLVIAGPDDDHLRSDLEALILQGGCSHSVSFVGVLGGALKWSTYAAATVFVLPSHSEGFSMATIEALGTGTPTLLSPNCYFPEVEQFRAGWISRNDPVNLSDALSHILTLKASEMAEVGARAKHLVYCRYSWENVAQQFSDLYGWCLGDPTPASVEFV